MSYAFPQLSVSNERERQHGARAGLPTSEMRIFFRAFADSRKRQFCATLHIRIVRPASALWRDPLYVFRRVLDIASFAVDTVLRVDDKAWVCVTCLVRVNNFVDASWAEEARGFPEPGQIVTDGDVRIMQPKMNGLILFVVGVGKIDGRRFVER